MSLFLVKALIEPATESSLQHILKWFPPPPNCMVIFFFLCVYFIHCVDHNKLKNSSRDGNTRPPDLLTCFLRNLYAGQEATVRTGHGTKDWFQIGKGVCQGCILSPCLFDLYAETSFEMLGVMKHKLESRLLGDISITSDVQMTPPLWQKVKKN